MSARARRGAGASGSASIAAAAAVTMLALGMLDARIDIEFGAGEAEAIDLFGSEEEKEKAAEPFWKESTGGREVAPPAGAPASFADLAERVSPAIVNIQTSKKVGGKPGRRPRHPLEEFFGPPFGEFFGHDDIDFESAEFSRNFYVKSSDRKWAFDILHARAMEFLLAEDGARTLAYLRRSPNAAAVVSEPIVAAMNTP